MTPKALGWTFLASAAAVAALGILAGRRSRMDRMGGLGVRKVGGALGGFYTPHPRTREELAEMCQGLDYHLVQGDPHDFYENRYAYHWTSEKNLPGIRKRGLGSHPPHMAEEHEMAYLYCMGHGESAAYVDELLTANPRMSFDAAVTESLRKFFPDWHRVWFSFNPTESSGWGNAQVRIDLEKLGDWIHKQKLEAFMYPDDAYGYGLFLPKRIPARFLSIRTGEEAGMAGLGGRGQPLGLRLEADPNLHKLVAQADVSLPFPASDAVTDFVGCEAKRPRSGIMCAHELEDAFSDQPSSRGHEVRQQLAEAVVPVR